MPITSCSPSDDAKQRWFKQQADQTLSRYRTRIAELEASIDLSDFGPHGGRRVRFSVASNVKSWSYFTLETTWAVFCALAGETREKTSRTGGNLGKKGSDAMTLASLYGGTNAEGVRAIAQNAEGFDILGLDFDLGHYSKNEVEAKCRELGLECVVTESYSSGMTRTDLVWATFDESGVPTMSEFAEYAQTEFNVVDHEKVIAEQCEAYLVDVEGYDAERLGKVALAGVFNSASDPENDPSEISIAVEHAPIPKSRVFVLLNERVEIAKGERVEKFKERYKRDVYDPIAAKFGHCDPTCSSIERRWYWRTHRPFHTPAPAFHVSRKQLEFVTQGIASEPRKEVPRGETGGAPRTDWRGFLAAAAAADLIERADDKRGNQDHPLVAVNCPFRSSHGKSKAGVNQLMVHDAGTPNRVPVAKCHSATCQGHEHTWEDYLSALFTGHDVSDPKYWLRAPAYELPVTSNFIVPLGHFTEALLAMNERWSVVRIGGKTRYMVFRHDGIPEFLDKTNLLNEFEAAYYETKVVNDEGKEQIVLRSFLPTWLNLSGRSQYRGYGFFPAPAGHPLAAPEGVFNACRGPTVVPKPGTWKRLLAHLYRNVCQRNAERFRWLIGYLAQLIQEPHVKPGTHIVLCGNEGTGKSKLGEWLIRLLKPCAMSITSRERLTGRFNAHYERMLFGLAEEVFWAGDKEAEGAIKALATAEELDYERKGIDPEPGRNYTRLMICSNEDWVVPAGSGGRRWFVLRVGNEHEQDNAYFAAIDAEMEDGGLAAMLHDLQRSPLGKTVNVRKAPVTPWLVEQRLHSQDARKVWWRSVLTEGGFHVEDTFVALDKNEYVRVGRDDLFASAKPFFERKGRPATREMVAAFIRKELEPYESLFYDGGRVKLGNKPRTRTYVIASYEKLREVWAGKYGETIEDADDRALPNYKDAEHEGSDDGFGSGSTTLDPEDISDTRH